MRREKESANFSMRGIEILHPIAALAGVSIDSGSILKANHAIQEYPMDCENPIDGIMNEKTDERKASPSRLTDEKISDETGPEATSDKVHAPAGLNNPFWN
jgi:hypothetical protein